MPETYKPGSRKPVFGQNHKISEDRYAWVITDSGKFLIIVGKDEGHGTDVVLFHPRPGKIHDFALSLTNLTIPELDAMETLFTDAFKWARPVVERRDKEAEDAWEQGDDSHSRNYRPLPTVVYRKRPELQYGEGVQERSDRVPEGGGGDGTCDDKDVASDPLVRVRGTGDGLAQYESEQGESQDDSTETD